MYTRSTLLSLIFATAVFCSQPGWAGNDGRQHPVRTKPSADAMILDGLVYRPLSLAGTIIGAGIFVVTLPFSLAGGNVEQAGETLVMDPARFTFTRCLGCVYFHEDDFRRE